MTCVILLEEAVLVEHKLCSDPLVNRVISSMITRSNEGMKKYGVTMERKDVTKIQWLRHAQEEALDLAIYLERCISDLELEQERELFERGLD